MHRVWMSLWAMSLSLSVGAAPAGAPAPELNACMRANLPAAVRVNRFAMTTEQNGHSETLTGKLFIQRQTDARALTLQIESPSHYRGSAYLYQARDGREDMFIYLPATGRVRQISGSSMDGAFFGSAFRYADLRRATGVLSGAVSRRGEDQTYDNGPVAVVTFDTAADTAEAALPTSGSLLVDPERCVPLYVRVEREQTLLREFIGKRADLVADEGRWYLAKGTMIDHERSVTTDIRLGELRGFETIPSSVFHRSSFHHAVFTKK